MRGELEATNEALDESAPLRASRASAAPSRHLPSEEREAQLFMRLRWRLARAQLRSLWAESRLRVTLVAGLSMFFWIGLFLLFYGGFRFVVDRIDGPGARYHAQIMAFVFTLFFLSLQVMLIFSSGIILYSGLYPTRETAFLLTLPARDQRIVLYRFQEALFFSSWGFFLLSSPMLVAYGLVTRAAWQYFALLAPLMASFAYIPCSLGAILCLLLVDRLPRWRRILVGAAALAVIVVAYHSIWRSLDISSPSLLGASWFRETFHRFRFTREEWLPSTWLSHALIEAARRPQAEANDLPWLSAGMYLAVLASNAMVLHLSVMALGKRAFRRSYWGLHGAGGRPTRKAISWIDGAAFKLLRPLHMQTRLLIVKDLRLFRRDPVQWSQFLIFFGLVLLYFANIERFRQHRSDLNVETWVHVVSFLNLAVVGLILSTFTTRFIYPLISLEGRRFWILSMLPLDRDRILWGKFVFAAIGSWIPSAALVLVSDLMLRVNSLVIGVHQLICLLVCLGLAGMAVGFGALMPNFQEPSPSKIAAGFGGTLNLVLSALFILAVVLMTVLPCHFFLLAGRTEHTPKLLQPKYLKTWLALGLGASLALSWAAAWIPMRAGLRAFRKLET